MLLPWLAIALLAFALPLATLRATHTVGCQKRADLRRREGCHHGGTSRHNVDGGFWHAYPRGRRMAGR